MSPPRARRPRRRAGGPSEPPVDFKIAFAVTPRAKAAPKAILPVGATAKLISESPVPVSATAKLISESPVPVSTTAAPISKSPVSVRAAIESISKSIRLSARQPRRFQNLLACSRSNRIDFRIEKPVSATAAAIKKSPGLFAQGGSQPGEPTHDLHAAAGDPTQRPPLSPDESSGSRQRARKRAYSMWLEMEKVENHFMRTRAGWAG